MSLQYTFGIVKPDAIKRGITGKVISVIEQSGLSVVSLKTVRLSRAQAEGFYAEHKERPFFGELVDFMISSPVVVLALKGENAVEHYRKVMGATDPKKAEEGTVRQLFGVNIGENTVHGSDSEAAAERELAYFFSKAELI